MRTLHVGLRGTDLERSIAFYVVQVERMDDAVARLAAAGIDADDPVSPDGSGDFRTTWITDPDVRRIELVQWPTGHADGLSASDWAD